MWLNPAVLRMEGLSARGSNCGAVFNAVGFVLRASAARAEKKPTFASSGSLISANCGPPGWLGFPSAVALLPAIGSEPSVALVNGAG